MSVSLFDRNREDELNADGSPKNPTNQNSGISSFSTGMNANGGQKQGSGRFTNLQKYISANEGAGEQISNKISSGVDNQYKAFDQDFNKNQSNVDAEMNKSKDLFDTSGEDYKNKLNTFNTGLNSFGSMTNRDQFDQTGKDIVGFYNANKDGFNNIKSGGGLDQAALQTTQGVNQGLLGKQQEGISNQLKNIQSETGRYDLMKLAAPKAGGLSQGQNRLDQLFFQSSPNAVKNLQNTFQAQNTAVGGNQNALNMQKDALGALVSREDALTGSLQSGANDAQSAFYNKLNQQKNYDDVNAARTGLYNDYLTQMQSKNYSQDLANMLGVNGLQTYNPTAAPPVFDNVSQKMTTPVAGVVGQNQIADNQFRQYNVNTTAADALTGAPISSNYLSKGSDAANFQDLLRQPDFDTYNALDALAGNSKGKATGTTTLNPAVSKNINNDLARDVSLQNKDFMDNRNKNYIIPGVNEVYSNLNDYLYTGNLDPKSRPSGSTEQGRSIELTPSWQTALQRMVDGAVNESGVKNVATINQDDTREKEAYKRFKGLL